jgi:signal transduction histidine kinase
MKPKITVFRKMIILSSLIELIMLLVILVAFYIFGLNSKEMKLVNINQYLLNTSNLRLELLNRRDSNFAKIYHQNFLKIYSNIEKSTSVIKLDSILAIYRQNLIDYKQTLYIYGLNENTGVEGIFRNKIHLLEANIYNKTNPNIHILLLQIRRREKDYIIRGRQDYAKNVYSLLDTLRNEILFLKIPDDEKNKLLILTNEYYQSFEEFVIIKDSINKLEKKMMDIESNALVRIKNIINEEEVTIQQSRMLVFPLFSISIIFSLILSIIIARSVTNPIVHLKNATVEIGNGNLNTKVKVESSDEIGDLAEFFNQMTTNLSKANQIIISQQTQLNHQFSELKEINATRDKFFSIIAHDLKNPIGSFMGVSEFIVNTFNSLSRDEIREFLDAINVTAKQLYELLENLLLWSRAQRGLIPYHPIEINVNSIIQNNIELLRFNADLKNIQLNYNIEKPFVVYADVNMLSTILRNLLTNAIKFTKENGIISVICTENENYCLFKVEDNGVGIPDGNIKNLFNIESSITTKGTRQESGTGLGLIICKDFVEMHTGEIWVESTLNNGSKFYFTIPLIKDLTKVDE